MRVLPCSVGSPALHSTLSLARRGKRRNKETGYNKCGMDGSLKESSSSEELPKAGRVKWDRSVPMPSI
ncbi:hypothetical protein M404DRAFT_1003846 [Pisolithus tinctorius Marx 270]|uniref:Uncharacterized protein n=1 Tax=Pisolithus tinctorius Marx 270 TaxID=870435 RepID=A0A0C3IU65_PISTI|nr:hypothetical protein M404DRAFT_1003846 [Pisolithus tinctorius Marx 270]